MRVRALVLDDDERVLLVRFEFPWWTLEELEASAGEFAPGRLPLLARELILNGPPAEPIDVGVQTVRSVNRGSDS